MSFSRPRFRGRDSVAVERRLDALAKQVFAARAREWRECQTPDSFGITCPPWEIETTCETVRFASVLSVICMNRLNEIEYPSMHPSIDYDAVNVTVCGGTLRILELEKDICPAWGCLDELYAALVRNAGVRAGSLDVEPGQLKSAVQQFYLADEHIVFVLGDRSASNLDFNERFTPGYNIAVLPYAELVKVAPAATELLRDLGFAQVDGGHP
jgi:hypothetical protein